MVAGSFWPRDSIVSLDAQELENKQEAELAKSVLDKIPQEMDVSTAANPSGIHSLE